MSKYCTIVNFAATYEHGVYIDSKLSEPWEVARTYYDLMQHASSKERSMELFKEIPQPYKGIVDRVCNAYRGMTLRRQFNGHIDGPHIFHTDEPLTDEFLIDWAKHNVFKKEKAQ